MLDDEQQLVVLGRVALRLLGGEQQVEPQVVAVRHLGAEVALDAGLQMVERSRIARPGGLVLHADNGSRAASGSVRARGEAACQVRVWRPDWPCPVGGDPRASSATAAATRRTASTGTAGRGTGAASARRPGRPPCCVQARPRLGEVHAEAWGPAPTGRSTSVPALLGADDDPSGFEPRHPVLVEVHRRHPHWRLGRSDLVMEALVPAIVEQKVTGKEAFAGLPRAWCTGSASGRPGPGRERKLWLQPTRRAAPHDPVLGVAADAHRPGPLPHHRHRRPGRRRPRADSTPDARPTPSCAPCPASACGPAPRCASARSATPTRSASATTTSPRTSAGR